MKTWRVFVTPAADRVIWKLPKECSKFVLEKFPPAVRANPFIGKQLIGPLAWLRSFHFSIQGKPYRIAYCIDSARSEIIIHYAGYRGGFYERLRKHLQ